MENALFKTSTQVPQDPNLDGSRAPIEKILSPDVIAEVKEDLKREWFIMERDQYRVRLACFWSHAPLYTEYQMLKLDSIFLKRGSMLPCIQKGMEYLFCNKATAFYWTQSTQTSGNCGPLILGQHLESLV